MPGILVEPRLHRVAMEDEAIDALQIHLVAQRLERVGIFLPSAMLPAAAVKDSAPTSCLP